MDDYIRLGLLIIAAIALIIMFFSSQKAPTAHASPDADDETPPVFSDNKDDFNYDFLLKGEPQVEFSSAVFEKEIEAPVLPQTITEDLFDNLEFTQKISSHPDLLTLCVMAKPGTFFASYDLLQTISAAGMQFGAMNIFHYYQEAHDSKITLFSLASVNEPGEFDLNNMGDFSCSGLILFMKLSRVPDPHSAFRFMLEAAERLAEDLDGEIKADPRTPWTVDISNKYQEKIIQAKSVEYV